ncbi:Cyclic nucleotide gated channel subunit beta 1 [Balamuthia mandrillaris]
MKDQREKQKETEEEEEVEVETEEEEEEEKEEEEEEKEEEKEKEAPKPSTAEKRGTKRKRRSTGRSPAWTWQESFTLLKLIEKHGKGKWEFMLEQLQRLHLCNKVRDGKAVAKHYSTLKGKKSTLYNSNWEPPEFDRQSLLGKSAPKQRRLEEAHATTVQQLMAEREEARQIITKLEKSESVLDSAKKKKIAEAKKDVEDAAKERAKERERRLKEAEMEAKQARESREIITKLAKAQLEYLEESRKTEAAIREALGSFAAFFDRSKNHL